MSWGCLASYLSVARCTGIQDILLYYYYLLFANKGVGINSPWFRFYFVNDDMLLSIGGEKDLHFPQGSIPTEGSVMLRIYALMVL